MVGGTKVSADVTALAHRPPSLLVGTPGRLLDLLEGQGMLHAFSAVQVLIFDEADQLLDLGFRPAIEAILRALRPTAAARQTLLFSATMPADVAQVGVRVRVRVRVSAMVRIRVSSSPPRCRPTWRRWRPSPHISPISPHLPIPPHISPYLPRPR